MILNPRSWKSLSSEITAVYATLSICLVAIVSYVGYQANSRILEEQIRNELLDTVDQTLKRVNVEFDEGIREVHTITLSPIVREIALRATEQSEALELVNSPETVVATAARGRAGFDLTARAEQFLRDIRENHPHIAEIFITDRYGINAAMSNDTTDMRQNDETWWNEAVTRNFYLSNLVYDDSAGTYAYSIAMPILDEPRPPVGVVKVVINLKPIQEFVNAVGVGKAGYLVILSADGRLISHPRVEDLYRPVKDVADLAPIASTLQRSFRGVHGYSREMEDDDDEWLVGYSRLMRPASLGPLNWTVAALVSRAEVMTPLSAVRNFALLAGSVFVLAAVPIVFALSRRLSRPLCDLARRADDIRDGDFEVSLAIPEANEIGRLASALSSMVDNLKTSHKRTLEINAGLEKTVRERTDELRQKNRQIEDQNKRVMESSRLKSQFLANMSHELRTPLNAVLALSEILSDEMSGPLNEEQVKQVSIINRSGKSLLRLINDVLDLSKIEAGRMTVERVPLSVMGLINLVADTLRPLAEDKNLTLTSRVAEGLPEYIHGDENKLRQILINLVGNGIKFTDQGGVTLDVSYTEKPKTISFKIIDTGIGIADDATGRIFEEFRQADGSTTRKYGGTGLGLTISKKMAELMGGTLVVNSAIGEGSTFALSVPYELAPAIPDSPTEALRRVRLQVPEPSLMSTNDDSATTRTDGRPLVLVAEDEQDNLYVMKKYLNRMGCQVIFARDGNEALEKTQTYSPVAIVLDLVLPRKNGWEVLSELKANAATRDIPVIVASALDNQERAFCLGAFRYLVKPVKETELADAIGQIQWAERKHFKRILLIDDNIVDSDLTVRLLSENKYEVLRACDATEGLGKADTEKPDLIMLDLNLPDMNGFDALGVLKEKSSTRDIPVVIYTAGDLSLEEERRLGSDAERIFLKNPLDPNTMLRELSEVLNTASKEVAAPDGSSSEETPHQTIEAGVDRDGALILVVEDDPSNQYTLEYMLRTEGYEVQLASNGQEGLEQAARLKPDVILMDMMMPVMGGHEATRTLRDTAGIMDIPVIALTAAAMTGDREKALAAGCDDYVSKPVNRDLLLKRLEHWVEKSCAAKEMARQQIASSQPSEQ